MVPCLCAHSSAVPRWSAGSRRATIARGGPPLKTLFLFTELGEGSPCRAAFNGHFELVTRVLRGSWFDCPISLPPDLVVVEPAPLKPISGLVPALAQHPVVGRVPWVIVLDAARLHLAAALPCSDFLVRGFAPDEALARVERLLLRRPDPRAVVRSGPITLDRQLHEARLLDAPLPLAPQEFALLRHFVLNPGKALSRESLLLHVWGADYEGGARTVDVHVRRLRAHLGSAAGHLQTVRQVGYCWLE